MSGNNSPEIVTQKEFEKVLANKTFDAQKFLELYLEWKRTHDTGTFAELRSMHQDAGYKNKNIVFGSETEMHEIAVIVRNFLDKKTQITTAVTTGTAAVAATNNNTVAQGQPSGEKNDKPQASPENIKDIKSLLLSRKKGHIESAIKSGFYPIPNDKKVLVEKYIEDKFSILNAAINDSSNISKKQRAQEAYKDIIYCVTNGGNMNRPSGQGEEIKFRTNGSDVQDTKDYLLNLINKEIPASRIQSDTQVPADSTKPDTQKENPKPDTQKNDDKKEEIVESNNSLKNGLEKYAGYATQELSKVGKTIKNLQEKLAEKKFYSGEITGTFDEATLKAVFDFQKTIPHPVYGEKGIDGLVGPKETIPALFGNSAITGSTRPIDSTSESANPPAIRVPRVTPQPSSTPQEANNSISENKKNLTKAYEEFIAYAKSTDKFMAGFRNSKEDIQNIRKTLSEKFEKFNTTLQSYIQSGAKAEDINWMRLNIAYYYSNDLEGVSANNQLDVVASQNLCLDILGNKIPKLPSTEKQLFATLENLQTKNPRLADLISTKIAEQQEKGEAFNLSAILSNPLVKGGWEKAYDEIYGESLKKLDNALDVLKGQKQDTLSVTEKKALNHLRDIRGKDGAFDFTVQNREQMWQMLKYGSAVVAGIAATIPTGGASMGMLVLGAGIGATVTTGGVLLAQGYRGTAGEVATEAGINLISFGGGAILFKIASGARAVALAEKTSKVLVYGAEGIGNIGIGVGTDTLRARLNGTDLDIWNSIQQNLVWAALPFAFRMKGVKVPNEVMKDAEKVENLVQAANVQAALGKSPKSVLEKAKAPLDNLKSWGEKGNVSTKAEMNLDNFKKGHLSGDALYERVGKLGGGKKIEIEGLPGYTIGLTADGRKLEVFGPKGGVLRFHKDQLERNLEGIYNLERRANPTVDMPIHAPESVVPTTNGATSHGSHSLPEGVVPVAPHVATQGAVPRPSSAATPHDAHPVPPAANTTQAAHTAHHEPSTHSADHGAGHSKPKSSYEFKGLKSVDAILMGDNRKFREIFPFTDNNVWQGAKKLTTGEMKITEAIHNSAAWVQNQTFSQIYTEMAKPWKGNTSAFLKNSIDNARTLLISGESGKWMSKDRLGKLGIIVGATTLDYMTSEEGKKNSDGLLDSIGKGIGFTFQKYALNPQETLKLYQEIILLNWIAIVLKEAPAIVGAGVGITTATVNEVGVRLK